MSKPVVNVSCRGNRKRVDPRTVRRRAERVLAAVGRDSSELSVLLCDDEVIKELNRDYRGLDKPTDVLSFSMNEGGEANPNPELLGDVVISVETAERQGKTASVGVVDEVTSLLIHGVLHLLGYDHNTPFKSKKMMAEASRIESVLAE